MSEERLNNIKERAEEFAELEDCITYWNSCVLMYKKEHRPFWGWFSEMMRRYGLIKITKLRNENPEAWVWYDNVLRK